MSTKPRTCDICGALITEERGGELVTMPGGSERVWVHPACRGRQPYVPEGDAREAYKALDDPREQDNDFWVTLRDVEAERRLDSTDYITGLAELVERGWAEAREDGAEFRLTPTGRSLRSRVLPASS